MSLEIESGEMEYNVVADASNTDSNEVSRVVEFTSPPSLEVNLSGPEEVIKDGTKISPNPFYIKGLIRNTGGSPAYNINANVALPPGLSLAHGDKGSVPLGTIEAGEEVEVLWRIMSLQVPGRLPFGLEVQSLNAQTVSKLEFLDIPDLDPFFTQQ